LEDTTTTSLLPLDFQASFVYLIFKIKRATQFYPLPGLRCKPSPPRELQQGVPLRVSRFFFEEKLSFFPYVKKCQNVTPRAFERTEAKRELIN
jgi:hypothetical protein